MMTVRDFENARVAVALLRARDLLPWWAFLRRRRLIERAQAIAREMRARELG